MAVVLHEDRIMVEPFQAELAKQMRQAIAARLQLGIGHGLAGGGHDEGGLQRAEMSMLAGVHDASQFFCAARTRICRTAMDTVIPGRRAASNPESRPDNLQIPGLRQEAHPGMTGSTYACLLVNDTLP